MIWLGRLTVGVLALSVSVVSGVASTALLRAAGVELGSDGASPRSRAPMPLPRHPSAVPDRALPDDAPEIVVDPDRDGDGDDRPPSGAIELGLTRDKLRLHERPSAGAEVVGDLAAGELVSILRVVGDWVLVYHSGPAGAAVGYVKKSEIAVR